MKRLETHKKKILLHSCCGPCSSGVLDFLVEDYDISVYFYNPNITDLEEYQKRLEAQKQVIQLYNEENGSDVTLIEGEYRPEEFLEFVKGLENEKEGGKRCEKCFELRIKKAADYAEKKNCELYSTTLTISPHKDAEKILALGEKEAEGREVGFLNQNFRKKAGFEKSIKNSKRYGIYRQNFCGCEFSRRG